MTDRRRAYSVLTLKSVDEAERVIEGTATTPTPDREGDVVEPEGAVFELPIPFLRHHNSREPVGFVEAAKVTAKGIDIRARLAKTDEPGLLRDRLELAWHEIKAGLVRGLSIGFVPIESARIENTFGYRFLKWSWLELSAVTIPANADATMQTVKSIGEAFRKAELQTDRAPVAAPRESVRVVKLNNAPASRPYVIREIKRL